MSLFSYKITPMNLNPPPPTHLKYVFIDFVTPNQKLKYTITVNIYVLNLIDIKELHCFLFNQTKPLNQ